MIHGQSRRFARIDEEAVPPLTRTAKGISRIQIVHATRFLETLLAVMTTFAVTSVFHEKEVGHLYRLIQCHPIVPQVDYQRSPRLLQVQPA